MKNNKKCLIVLLLLATMAVAPNLAWAARKGDYYAYIFKVDVGENGKLAIDVWDGGPNFRPGVHGPCQNTAYAEARYPLSDERTKAMLSMALASFLGHRRVYVTTDGCNAGGSYVLVDIQLEDKP